MTQASAPPSDVVLAIDVGTSSCRASLYDQTGQRVPDVGAKLEYFPTTTDDGGAVLDPDKLFEQVCRVVDQVVAEPVARGVLGVGVTTFWHSLLGVDERGAAITPLYTWADARAGSDIESLKQTLDERAVHARTGCMLHWSYWPAKLFWLRRTQPATFERVTRWMSFGEYLALKLFGEAGVSHSMASGTGLFDQHRCDWDEEVLRATHVAASSLSPIVPLSQSHEKLQPMYAQRWPRLAEVPWLPAIGDGASSNLGAGCTTRERFALMVGTSGAERVVWATDQFDIPWGTWCYRVDERRVILGGALNDGGGLFDWFRKTLNLPAIAEAETQLAAMEPDVHGLTVLPFWAGERSPGWASNAQGAIVGLRLHTHPADILRAALEAIALRFGKLDAILRNEVPEGRDVIATGGALLNSPAWMQIMADVLERPIAASAEPQASSRGAALLALETLNQLAEPLESMQPPIDRVFDPNPSHSERYRAAAARQDQLYQTIVC